jgi:hypothetical protein
MHNSLKPRWLDLARRKFDQINSKLEKQVRLGKILLSDALSEESFRCIKMRLCEYGLLPITGLLLLALVVYWEISSSNSTDDGIKPENR